jgi:Glycosyl transferase family 2
MKIHALCIIRNEVDIISQTLISATNWCDFIYCFDNGSTDGTWEKIVNLSRKYSQVIPYKQEACPFRDSLRSQIFNQYRANSLSGDWWCRLDADEIYIDNPAQFLVRIPKKYNVVVTATFQYYFTDKDLELYASDPSLYSDDISVEKKYRYYLNNWSEVRFFRYREDLTWCDDREWPSNLHGDAYPIRIKLKNFQYRSPEQMQKRIETRYESTSRGLFVSELQILSLPNKEAQNNWKDWKALLAWIYRRLRSKRKIGSDNEKYNSDSSPISCQSDLDSQQMWRRRIANASDLYCDENDGHYILRNDFMPNIYTMSLIWDYRVTPKNLLKRIVKKLGSI